MSTTKKQQWKYGKGERVWVGKYINPQNTLHWHNDCELVYVEHGTLTVTVNGMNYSMTRGNAMFIDSRVLHRISAVEETSISQIIIFDNSVINDFAEDISLCSPLIDYGEKVGIVYGELLEELKSKPPLYTVSTAGKVRKLMIDIFRSFPTEQKKPSGNTDEKLKALFTELKNNYDWYTLGDAATFMGMNASYLSRFFTAKTGMHFMRYVNCMRVEKAMELIKSGGFGMTEIATRCGFGTIRNFNSIFKQLTGYVPSKLPRGYIFPATVVESDMQNDPTLVGCELIESSS